MSAENINTMSEIASFFDGQDKGSVSVGLNNCGQDNATQENLDRFYSKLEEMGYNLEEMKQIFECDKSMLVIAGAGSGKTTTLLLKIIRDMISGELMVTKVINGVTIMRPANILVSTFLKTGAEDLKRDFAKWCNRLNLVGIDTNSIHFKTIHSEVYAALSAMGMKVNITTETNNYIKQAMYKYNIHSVMSTGRTITKDEIDDIKCLISYTRNRLDAQRFNHPLMNEYTIDTIQFDAMLKLFKQFKMAEGLSDFEDLQEMLLEGLQCNPKVVEFIQNRYDYVFVDEFQDTSQLQYEILKYYFNGAKKVIAIGDDDQTIYSWRGSDIDIINTRFEDDYNPEIKKLTTNYRCAANILNAIIPSIEKNSVRHPKKLRAGKQGGVVNIVVDGSINNLMQNVKEDLFKGESVGIIARTNADLLIPAILLELDENDIDFGLSKSVSLDTRIPKNVIGVMDLITKRYTPDFSNLFKLFVGKYRHYEVDKLCDILNINKDKSIFTLPIDDLRYSVPTLFPMLQTMRLNYAVSPKRAYIGLLDNLIQDVYNGKSIYAQNARDFVYYMKRIIVEHDAVKDMPLETLNRMFTVVLPKRLDRKKDSANKNLFIKLTTVHEAKGKEWDNVYIWNDVNGCFPNSVGNRDLTQSEFEEERRVHYIAWTRPIKKLTVYTRSSNQGGFLNECNLDDANIVETKGLASKTAELGKNVATTVFEKKTVQKEKSFEDVFNDYYTKYTSYEWLSRPIGFNLDMCYSKLGSKDNIIAELKQRGIDKYPKDMMITAITDTISEIINS